MDKTETVKKEISMHLRKWYDPKGCTELNKNEEEVSISRREDGSSTELSEFFSWTDRAIIENGQGYC